MSAPRIRARIVSSLGFIGPNHTGPTALPHYPRCRLTFADVASRASGGFLDGAALHRAPWLLGRVGALASDRELSCHRHVDAQYLERKVVAAQKALNELSIEGLAVVESRL